MSWNNIGNSEECISTLFDKLAENKLLIQLDISQNGIKGTNLQYFSDKLKLNHTLVGLHLNGNNITLDISGNVIEVLKDRKILSFQSENMDYQNNYIKKLDKQFLSNNWITEKWQKTTILCTGKVVEEKWVGDFNSKNNSLKIKMKRNAIKKFRTANKGEEGRDKLIDNAKIKINFANVEIETPCFVHFEFDNFQPWFIPINKESKEFIADFMIPPGKWNMFFTTQMS